MKKAEIESYIKAGEIAKKIKKFARDLIKPRMKLIDIADAIDDEIFKLGGEPAFPVNLSLNEIAAHFTPAPDCEIVAEGILKVDIGVAIDGFIADTAFSIDLTPEENYKEMIELNTKILEGINEIVKPGVKVCDVGNRAQDILEEWNKKHDSSFAIIKSLSGHALGQDTIHAGLTISNYRNNNNASLDGKAFAIEPFVTMGVGDIYEGNNGGIYVLQSNGNVRDKDAREILKYIKEFFGTRPFCIRFLIEKFEKFSLAKLRLILGLMVKTGILHEYPMLIEKSRGFVSQMENTFIINGDEVIRTTK